MSLKSCLLVSFLPCYVQFSGLISSKSPLSVLIALDCILSGRVMRVRNACPPISPLITLFLTLAVVPGISQLVQCGQLGDLPELPAPDEQRLQKAASLLQQRLILRQWLTKYDLQHHYPRWVKIGQQVFFFYCSWQGLTF